MSIYLERRAVAAALRGDVAGPKTILAPGPGHSPADRSLSVTFDPSAPDGFWVNSFAGDPWQACRDHVRETLHVPHWNDRRKPAVKIGQAAPAEGDRHAKARWLWGKRHPIIGSGAETYVWQTRGITCPLPATLGFLPGNDRHPAALIAAFGLAHEIEPGVLAIDECAVMAVHLTKLLPDGNKQPDQPNKIMIGSANGAPIILAPMNDLLGVAITEGIEDALSMHQATGLGAWAAGSANRMPALADAVPDYTDCVTVVADANEAGERNSALLAERLNARGIYAEVVPSAGTA